MIHKNSLILTCGQICQRRSCICSFKTNFSSPFDTHQMSQKFVSIYAVQLLVALTSNAVLSWLAQQYTTTQVDWLLCSYDASKDNEDYLQLLFMCDWICKRGLISANKIFTNAILQFNISQKGTSILQNGRTRLDWTKFIHYSLERNRLIKCHKRYSIASSAHWQITANAVWICYSDQISQKLPHYSHNGK